MKQIELTEEESVRQAQVIEIIKVILIGHDVDVEYLKAAVKEMRDKASFYDSTAPLNRGWNENGSKLINEQANTLEHLALFIDGLKKCDELRKKVKASDDVREEFSKMFGI